MLAATKNGRHRNVLHFGIPAASQNDNFPSQADAAGAIGTPPPSALKFIAAVKIILFFCKPSSRSKKISASAVCIVNNDCTVSTRYVSFPSRILFRISLIVDFNAFLQTNASSPIPALMANSLFFLPKVHLSQIHTPGILTRFFHRI